MGSGEWKVLLIEASNPDWRGLYEEIGWRSSPPVPPPRGLSATLDPSLRWNDEVGRTPAPPYGTSVPGSADHTQ